jgi:hypothetical protein
MPIREGRRAGAAVLAVAGVLSGSCAGWRVPNNERAVQEEAVTGGKGARAYLRLSSGAGARGELISAQGVYVWLLRDDGRLVSYPVESVRGASLGVFQTRETELTAWTIVGSLSTISHGAFLIFSLPLWLLVGIPSSYTESRRGFIEYPSDSWEVLRRYARFPQGMTERMKVRLLSGATSEAPADSAPQAGTPDDGGAPSLQLSPTGDAGATL